MSGNAAVHMSVQSNTIGDTKQSVHDLVHKADTELFQQYGTPASMRLLTNGHVERTWNIGSGTLNVIHDNTGKASDVKFFSKITAKELESMTQNSQP